MIFHKTKAIDNVLVREEIVEIPFSCNLTACKGACCTLESELGAPLSEEEITQISGLLPRVKKYLPAEHLKEIEDHGFYEDKDGELLTRSLDHKACVFVHYENDVAKCSLEKLYFDEGTSFRKPLSCHLFPIRVNKFGGDVLRFEKFNECEPAKEKGKEENITVAEFCGESLIRSYGNNWYNKMKETFGI